MKMTTVAFTILLTACSTIALKKPLQDRYGVMSIEIQDNWQDETESYLKVIEEIDAYGKLRKDSGIRTLLMVKSDKNYAQCKFRELTYTSGEVGYAWSISRLTEEVADVNNRMLDTYGISDYLRLGVPVPIVSFGNTTETIGLSQTNNSTQTISSSQKRFGLYEGWEAIHQHSFDKTPSRVHGATTWTASILLPRLTSSDRIKKYLVAECATEGYQAQQNKGASEIPPLLQTIHINLSNIEHLSDK